MTHYAIERLKSSQPIRKNHPILYPRSVINELSDENRIKIGTIKQIKAGKATHTRGEFETK